jgi:hypothetical protein
MTPIRRHFDFLISEYGFTCTSDNSSVRYDIAPLYVEIWSGSGEIDLHFGVKVDTDVIRPYVSHRFSISEVVRYYKIGAFPTFASFSIQQTVSDEERYVMYLATLTRKYCEDILRGDITPFEKLSLNRSVKH